VQTLRRWPPWLYPRFLSASYHCLLPKTDVYSNFVPDVYQMLRPHLMRVSRWPGILLLSVKKIVGIGHHQLEKTWWGVIQNQDNLPEDWLLTTGFYWVTGDVLRSVHNCWVSTQKAPQYFEKLCVSAFPRGWVNLRGENPRHSADFQGQIFGCWKSKSSTKKKKKEKERKKYCSHFMNSSQSHGIQI